MAASKPIKALPSLCYMEALGSHLNTNKALSSANKALCALCFIKSALLAF